ncbi:MAG: hypothetical protein ACJ72Z_02520, partial [Pyrinomonadaceae bacterium]
TTIPPSVLPNNPSVSSSNTGKCWLSDTLSPIFKDLSPDNTTSIQALCPERWNQNFIKGLVANSSDLLIFRPFKSAEGRFALKTFDADALKPLNKIFTKPVLFWHLEATSSNAYRHNTPASKPLSRQINRFKLNQVLKIIDASIDTGN